MENQHKVKSTQVDLQVVAIREVTVHWEEDPFDLQLKTSVQKVAVLA